MADFGIRPRVVIAVLPKPRRLSRIDNAIGDFHVVEELGIWLLPFAKFSPWTVSPAFKVTNGEARLRSLKTTRLFRRW